MAQSDADSLVPAHPAEPADEREPGGEARARDPVGSGAAPLECARCGAVLPEDDEEGLCPMCGTPYGFKTREMPTLTPEFLARHGYSSRDVRAAGLATPAAPAAKVEQDAVRGVRLAAVAVLGVALALLVVLLIMLLGR